MVLFGIESANQFTLDKINKGVKVEEIIPTLKQASKAGIEPHITVMFGYPWESTQEAENTLSLVSYLLRKGYCKTAQASLYTTCRASIRKDFQRFVPRIYDAAWHPSFWYHQIKDIRNKADLQYLWLKIKKGLNERAHT